MIARRLLLAASTNAWLREKAMRTGFVRRSVSAFMPGERLSDAMAAASAEQAKGVSTIFTKLGENLTRASDAKTVTEHYLGALDEIGSAGLRAQISVKPTQLGLDFDARLCLDNLIQLVDRAVERRNFVWIDMEGSPYVDRTLDLFRHARARSDRVGIALQSYLHRTAADLESLMPLGPAVRIVKGAYLEPASIAFPRKRDVDENFYTLACRVLGDPAPKPGTVLHIATHDARLVDRLADFIAARQGRVPTYEHAMLYGIQRPLQERLLQAGQPLRVLIAYGDYWFPWYMRRLAERPANLWFVAKNLLQV
jgi:proline dehydrogenase